MVTRQKPGWTQIPPFLVTNEMAKDIEDVHYEGRYPNRTEALRAIISAGVEALKAKEKTPES